MRPEDWQLVQAHFEALCDLPSEEQGPALAALGLPDAVRDQVEQLLSFDQAVGLDALAAEVDQLSRQLDQSQAAGQHVGPYRLIRPLGEGGMGEVYLAERADGRFEAQVAIKFLAIRGARGQRLFDRERRILARLNHPAIARLLDAGEHPKLGAWLVMEYVDGQPIHRLLEQQSVDACQRIRWVAEAARAVSSAHQNLVLHRDIKPDHLIIDAAGQLKVLDFGVATLIGRQGGKAERTESASFTPRYAAPEQILNQATTTATDVYALGLVLFEVLSDGRGAFGEDPARMSEAKLAGERCPLPQRRDLSLGQMRDLDAILSRCLARQPEDRYSGPGALVTDLDAVVNDQPVSARPPAWSEQARRWYKRHRLAGTALLLAVVAIIGGSAFTAWFANSARIERNAAVQEAAKARAVTEFMESIFASSTPGIKQGPETTVRELLDRGGERIDEELGSQPEVAAYLALAIARSYMYLGLYDSALALLDSDRAGESDPLRWRRILLTARIANLKGHYADSVVMIEPLLTETLTANERAEATLYLATARINLGELDLAETAARQAIAVADKDEQGLVWQASGHNLLGAIAYNRGDLDGARAAFQDLYQVHVGRHGEIHDATGQALSNLATVAFHQGDLASALNYAQRSATVLSDFFGVENRAVAMSLRTVGMTYRHLGQAALADDTLGRATAALEAWGGREMPVWRMTLMQWVELKLILGQEQAARDLLAGLVPMENLDWQTGEQLTACRLQRLAVALGLAESLQALCPPDLNETPQSRAVAHYLLARRFQRDGAAGFNDELLAAEASLAQVAPPDPLLAQAVAGLKSSIQ